MNQKKRLLAGAVVLLAGGGQPAHGLESEANFVDGELIRFTGQAGNPNGAWCWFQDERAIVDADHPGEPVLMFTSISASKKSEAEQGDLDFHWYGLDSGAGGTVELHDRLGQDDHNVAALFQLDSGQTLAVYARHNKDKNTYSRLSEPHKPDFWSDADIYEGSAKSTYNNLLTAGVGAEKKLLNFSRMQGWNPNFLSYDEQSGSWQYGGRLLKSEGRPYLKYAASGDGTRIHVVATDQHPRKFDNSIYHGVTDGRALFDSKGGILDQDLGDQDAVEPAALTVVFKGDPDNVAWVADVAMDDNDWPVIAFSVQKDGRDKPRGSGGKDHRYHLARLSSGDWQQTEIAYAGERLYPGEDDYTGLVAIDPENTDYLVISSNADPVSGEPLISSGDGKRHYELFQGRRIDASLSFSWRALTSNSTVDNIRPIIPAWNSDRRVVLWMRGSYTKFTDFDTQIVGVVQNRSEPGPGAYDGPADKLHVYLLIGQSNMAGRASYSEEESGAFPQGYLLNGHDQWEPASNPFNRYSTIRKELDMQQMNPGYGFAQAMLKEDEENSLGLVVNAKGGTKIELWAKGTPFYNEALRRTRIAGETGTLKGILWHQGEANRGNPDDYLDQLRNLVENLRSDLGMPDLPFIAGQVYYDAETKPQTRQINEQIARLPEILPHTGYVSSDGLTTYDNTHFDTVSMKRLGTRYAEEMMRVQSQQ